MKTTWRGSLGAALAITALGVSALPARAQTTQQAPPSQRPPQTPPLPPVPVTHLEERLKSRTPDQVFSLTFSEPVSIRDVLLLAVQDTGYSVVLDPDVEGTFTGELKNVTLKQALDAALRPLNLEYSIGDNILRVFKRKMETRVFNLNYVATRRSGSHAISASTGATGTAPGSVAGGAAIPGAWGGGAFGGGLGGSQASITGSDSTDFFSEVEKGIQTLVSPDARYNVDRKAGLVQVSDYPDRLDKIGLYLDLVQLRVNRQVQIQAKVLEIDLNHEASAGINWSTVLRSAGSSVSLTQPSPRSAAGAFTLAVDIRDFSGLLKALETQGSVNVLSSPRVAAMNNEPMLMRVGTQDVFFVTTSQVDAATGRILQTTVSPQSINEGVVLNVTPQVSGDGIITMSISPSVTERTGQATSRLGDTVPIIAARETDTLVRVREGETVVIGGLMQERVTRNRSKVPVLGDIPLLGGLFRRDSTSKRKSELVILLTPTIMTPASIAADAAREQERLSEAQRAPIKK
jgi:MSHA type pilus biogenesis protein MshL